MCFCHFHSRVFKYHILGPASFRGFNSDPLYMRPSSIVGCFSFTSTRLFSISFDLKKVGKVRELVEQFKEIGIVPMEIILESVSLS